MAEYTCDICNREFDEEEKSLTNDEHKCILHCDKDSWYINKKNKKDWSKSKKKVNKFWIKIQKELDDIYVMATIYEPAILRDKHIYENVIFPIFQEDIETHIFKDNDDDQGTNFFSYGMFESVHRNEQPYPHVNTIFNKLNIVFENCIFLDKAEFSRYTLSKQIIFNKNIFYDEIKLNDKYDESVIFDSCTFQNVDVNINNIEFNNLFTFTNCKIEKKFDINNNIFKKHVNFTNTEFNKTNLKNITFEDIVIFKSTSFTGDVDFRDVTFKNRSIFKNCIFKNKVNFESASFEKDSIFYGITSDKNKLTDIKVANRETARIIKDFFEKENNIIEANRFYKLEMKGREKELKILKNPFNWLVFKVHSWSSNHSQNWIFPLLWIFIITFFYVEGPMYGDLFDSIQYKINMGSYLFDEMAKLINPFSSLGKGKEFTSGLLLYKVIIAYLMYQFIVSVRQNTRRK